MGVFVASLLLNGVYTLWPQLGKLHGVSEWHVGLGVFVMGIQIPIWSILFAFMGRRLGRPYLLATLLTLGGVGYWLLPACFRLAGGQFAYPLALLFLALCGVGISGGFFHSVFYSNSDPLHPGKSVGINESLVGMGNVLGPLIMGYLAGDNADVSRPWQAGLLIAALAAVAGMVIWANRRKFEQRNP
jgi:MFS family permease